MDQQLKNMMKELGEAINTSLSESDEVAEVISRIRSSGYDVFLVLEATIGFNERNADEVSQTRVVGLQKSTGALKVTSQDVKFLKSLRIQVDED